MGKPYPKKLSNPSNRTSLFTFVFGLVISTMCLSLGIELKNSVTNSNCSPVNWSIKSGYNYRTWDKLPNGIDRDTPFLIVAGVDIISQRFNDNVFSGSDYFNGLRGQQVQIKPADGKLVKGVL